MKGFSYLSHERKLVVIALADVAMQDDELALVAEENFLFDVRPSRYKLSPMISERRGK